MWHYHQLAIQPSFPWQRLRCLLLGLALLLGLLPSRPAQADGVPAGLGTVVAWGRNDFGQSSVPAGLSGVTALAGGYYHSLALKSNGTVVAWGHNIDGQSSVPAGLSNVTALAAGHSHSLALKSDGTVVAWGYNAFGQGSVPTGLNGVSAIAGGYYHNLALKSDGSVVAWGRNNYGQSSVPAGLNGVTAIATNNVHSLALLSNGTVVAWGDNSEGQSSVPARLFNVSAIATGYAHSLALKSDGTVVAWGRNSAGQISVPAGLSGVTAIAAGGDHSLALKIDGTVVAWGKNDYGQSSVPAGLSGVSAITANNFHSLALKNDGTVAGPGAVVAWGHNDQGQGNVPAGLSGVSAIAANHLHSLALKSNGTVVAWGHNSEGQGNVPAGLSGVTAIAAGHIHSLALLSNGTVVAWGNNSYQQSSVPGGLRGVTAIAAGAIHSLALLSNGTVVAWGDGTYGQGNVPAGLNGVTAIAAGDYHNLALKSDGTVVAWGFNDRGHFDVPVGLSSVTAIAAGAAHSLARKSDGSVVAWGFNDRGQINVPVGLSNVTALATGFAHSLARKSDGTVVAWGWNEYGQRSVPVGLSGVTAIATGRYHNLALIDSPPAVVAITRADANPTNAASVHFIATFAEAVTGVDSSDFTVTAGGGVTGASVSSVHGGNATYTVTVTTGSGDGTLRLDGVDDDTIRELMGKPLGGVGAGNGNFTGGDSYTLDKTLPTISSSVTRADNTPYTPGSWSNQAVTVGFACADNAGGSGLAIIFLAGATVSREGANQAVTNSGFCADNANNVAATVTVSQINLDLTPPIVQVTGVSTGAVYTVNSTPSAGCTTGDVLSGVATPATFSLNGGDPLGAAGTGVFTATCSGATDNAGNGNGASATYTVVNQALAAHSQAVTTTEDTPITLVLGGSGGASSSLTYHLVTAPTQGVLAGVQPVLVYIPAQDFNGRDTFLFQVNDGLADSVVATVTLAVTSVNDPPLAANDTVPTNQDAPVNIPVQANDSAGPANEDPTLTTSAVSAPAHGTVTINADGTLRYAPMSGFSGLDPFTYTVCDRDQACTTATVTVRVAQVNHAPLATNLALTTNEDTPLPFTLPVSDPDNDSLRYQLVSTPTHGTIRGVAPAVTYQPAANFHGSDQFTLQATDGLLTSTVAVVTLAVMPVNDAPRLTQPVIDAREDTPLAFTVAVTDADGDALIYTLLTPPAHGAITGTLPQVIYTPTANFHGADRVTFAVSDSQTVQASQVTTLVTATVTLNVQAVNDAPVAASQTIRTPTNQAVNFNLTASDAEGDALTYTLVSKPQFGTATIDRQNVVYTPNADFVGADSFSYLVSDGKGGTASATVMMSVGTGTVVNAAYLPVIKR